jgi:hypothetical protein
MHFPTQFSSELLQESLPKFCAEAQSCTMHTNVDTKAANDPGER